MSLIVQAIQVDPIPWLFYGFLIGAGLFVPICAVWGWYCYDKGRKEAMEGKKSSLDYKKTRRKVGL